MVKGTLLLLLMNNEGLLYYVDCPANIDTNFQVTYFQIPPQDKPFIIISHDFFEFIAEGYPDVYRKYTTDLFYSSEVFFRFLTPFEFNIKSESYVFDYAKVHHRIYRSAETLYECTML